MGPSEGSPTIGSLDSRLESHKEEAEEKVNLDLYLDAERAESNPRLERNKEEAEAEEQLDLQLDSKRVDL